MAISSTKNRRRTESTTIRTFVRTRFHAVGRLVLGASLALAVGGVGLLVYSWVARSELVAVRRAVFRGLDRATEAELSRLAGLSAGQNLLGLDVKAIERAMGAHPWVSSVNVSRRFPSTLEVQVKEHTPVGMVQLGELYLLNEAGEPFRKVQAKDSLDLPLVTGVEREEYIARPQEAVERFSKALALVRAFEANERKERVSEVRVSDGGVALVMGSGEEIRLGGGDHSQKLEQLARVRAELARRGLTASVIHLDNRSRPGWVAVEIAGSRSERTGSRSK